MCDGVALICKVFTSGLQQLALLVFEEFLIEKSYQIVFQNQIGRNKQ
jgi:hypothetical protein